MLHDDNKIEQPHGGGDGGHLPKGKIDLKRVQGESERRVGAIRILSAGPGWSGSSRIRYVD